MPGLDTLFHSLFVLLLIVASLLDFWKLELPDWLSTLFAAIGFLFILDQAGLNQAGLNQAAIHLAIGFAVWAGGVVLTMLGFWGGGDAKFMAATAVWIGWPGLIALVVCTAVAGGVWAIFLLLARLTLRRMGAITAPGRWPRALLPGEGMPYAMAIATAALLFYGLQGA